MECHNFSGHSPLTRDEVDDLRYKLKESREVVTGNHASESWHVEVPTFVGHQEELRKSTEESTDFAEPYVPILFYEEDGVRIIFGTGDKEDDSKPDLRIERRPHGWAFFFHPNAGDPVAVLYLLDDGRAYLLRELYIDPPIELVDEIPADIDRL